MGSYAWGLVFGTPHSTCITIFGADMQYMKVMAHVDTVVRFLIRMAADRRRVSFPL